MGVDIGRTRARQGALRRGNRRLMHWSQTAASMEYPEIPYVEVPTYPLGDYLYNRGRAISDLVKAELSWRLYLTQQPPDVQEAIAKVSRLFRNQNKSHNYV